MRLIDADALYMELSQEAAHRISQSDGSRFDTGRTNGIICARDSIKSAPTIEPVKHGRWIQVDSTKCRCSHCDIIALIALYPHGDKNFCPSCGARMGGEE